MESHVPLSLKYSKEFLKRKIHDLSDATINFNSLSNKLYALRSLNTDNIEELGAIPANYDKLSHLFRILLKKGARAFTNLIIALVISENDEALAILTEYTAEELTKLGVTQENQDNVNFDVVRDSKEVYRAVLLLRPSLATTEENPENDFAIYDFHINPIADILKHEVNLKRDRNIIISDLLAGQNFEDLTNLPGYYNYLARKAR